MKILSEKEAHEIENLINNWNETQCILSENLRAFRNFYNKNISWFENQIKAERHKFVKYLAQKLKNLNNIQQAPKVIKKIWEEILRENLNKNMTLSLNQKSRIMKILQKENLTEGDKKELVSILSTLPTERLISLLGNDFKKHTQNYIKWGWDFDQSVKRLMLYRFITETRNAHFQPQNVGKNPKTHQKLYNDGEKKECGHCHQIKPHEEYATRMMRGKKTQRSICKGCKIETEQIYRFKNKMKVVQNIYSGKLKGKCQKCNTGIERLPTLEYHHPNPELKNRNNINFNRNWVKTKQQLENEKVTILCVNCHSKEISHIYNNYKELIQEKDFSPNTTNKEIRLYVKSQISNPKHHNRVVQLIKKNEVIKQLYEGKCIACGKISHNDSLPALHFHHRNGNNVHPGSETFNAIKNKEISLMKNQLKEENCIVICGNCHKMDRTFHFKNLYKNVIPPEYWNQIERDYERIKKNIENFKFRQESNIPNMN